MSRGSATLLSTRSGERKRNQPPPCCQPCGGGLVSHHRSQVRQVVFCSDGPIRSLSVAIRCPRRRHHHGPITAANHPLKMVGRNHIGQIGVFCSRLAVASVAIDLSAIRSQEPTGLRMMVAFATAKSARTPQTGWRAKSRKPRKRLPSAISPAARLAVPKPKIAAATRGRPSSSATAVGTSE
jgi:hypothetical protein